jgi:hypothetical protein
MEEQGFQQNSGRIAPRDRDVMPSEVLAFEIMTSPTYQDASWTHRQYESPQ